MSADFSQLPADLPVPEDDGGADHLPGSPLPELALPSTQGGSLDLAQSATGLLVAYIYPRTGMPGQPLPDGWNDIPGACGCTPQSCSPSASTSPSPCSATPTSASPSTCACPPSKLAA